jgi:uncharacterized protein (DUF305 family)
VSTVSLHPLDTDLDDTPPDGPDEPDEGGGDEGPGDAPAGLPWPKVLVLGVALAFLGFAVATFVHRDRSPGEGSVDVGFLQDMITHHEQAVEMAQSELANGSDPTVQSFAREILMFQAMEIGSMDRLLSDWGQGRGDPERTAMQWMDMSVPVARMPGMATKDQLAALQEAKGRAADTMFLELMARHHAGGIHMARYAAEHAGESTVRELAASMASNQAAEVNEFAQTAEQLKLPIHIQRVEVPSSTPD